MSSLLAIAPEILIASSIVLVLFFDILKPGGNSRKSRFFTLGNLCVACLLSMGLFGGDLFQHLPTMIKIAIYGDSLAAIGKFLLLFFSIFCLIPISTYSKEIKNHGAEICALLLTSLLGALMLVQSNDLLTFFISFEMMSVPLYVLVGSQRYHKNSSEGSLKFFINAAVGSALLAFSISWLFGFLGTLELEQMFLVAQNNPQLTTPTLIALAFMLAALIMKVGGAPFHLWVPDAYQAAPRGMIAWLATLPKIAVFLFLLRLSILIPQSHNLLEKGYDSVNLAHDIPIFLSILAAVSMILGTASACTQENLDRLMAYSGVAQTGYILTAIATSFYAGVENDLLLQQKVVGMTIYYLFAYNLANVLVWTLLSGTKAEKVEDLSGFIKTHGNWIGVLSVGFFSLAGAPPLVGFIGKFLMFQQVLNYSFWPVLLAMVASTASLYYYFRIVIRAIFDEPLDNDKFTPTLNEKARISIIILSTLLVMLTFWPSLQEFCLHMSR